MPDTIGANVRKELDRFGGPGAGAMPDLVAQWPDVVGPAIAGNAWPARIAKDGTLHVSVSSSVWAFELTQLEVTIRSRLEKNLGRDAPKRLRFAVGRLPEAGPAREVESASRTVPKVSAAHRAAAAEIAAPIEYEGLREAVARAAAASLARHPSDRVF
jgi:hypothetical protein